MEINAWAREFYRAGLNFAPARDLNPRFESVNRSIITSTLLSETRRDRDGTEVVPSGVHTL